MDKAHYSLLLTKVTTAQSALSDIKQRLGNAEVALIDARLELKAFYDRQQESPTVATTPSTGHRRNFSSTSTDSSSLTSSSSDSTPPTRTSTTIDTEVDSYVSKRYRAPPLARTSPSGPTRGLCCFPDTRKYRTPYVPTVAYNRRYNDENGTPIDIGDFVSFAATDTTDGGQGQIHLVTASGKRIRIWRIHPDGETLLREDVLRSPTKVTKIARPPGTHNPCVVDYGTYTPNLRSSVIRYTRSHFGIVNSPDVSHFRELSS